MKSEEWQQQNKMETNDKIKALKEQALDWIEKELSSDNSEHIPKVLEMHFWKRIGIF